MCSVHWLCIVVVHPPSLSVGVPSWSSQPAWFSPHRLHWLCASGGRADSRAPRHWYTLICLFGSIRYQEDCVSMILDLPVITWIDYWYIRWIRSLRNACPRVCIIFALDPWILGLGMVCKYNLFLFYSLCSVVGIVLSETEKNLNNLRALFRAVVEKKVARCCLFQYWLIICNVSFCHYRNPYSSCVTYIASPLRVLRVQWWVNWEWARRIVGD